MPAIFSAEEIFEITSGRLAQGMMPDEEGPVICDTRLPLEGAWFAALSGAQFDGHDFLGDAFAGGAIGCIVEERTSYAIGSQQFPLIAVTDPLYAIADLARNWRRRLNPRLVAVACGATRMVALSKALERMIAPMRETLIVGCEDHRPESIFGGILGMSEETKIVVAAVSPENIEESELVASALRPDVIVILKESFSNLRLRESDEYVERALHALTGHLSKARGIVVIGDVEQKLSRIVETGTAMRLYVDEQVELVELGSGIQEMKMTGGASAGGSSASLRFQDCDPEEAWALLAVCQSLGLSDKDLSALSF